MLPFPGVGRSAVRHSVYQRLARRAGTKVQDLGAKAAVIPLMYVVYNIVAAALALLVGRWRLDRSRAAATC